MMVGSDCRAGAMPGVGDCGGVSVPGGACARERRVKRLIRVLTALALASLTTASAAWASGHEVVSWGVNVEGQLGDGISGSGQYSNRPVVVCAVSGCPAHLEEVKAVSAGGEHSLALLEDGQVVAWGDGEGGALGDGSTSSRATPQYVCAVGGCPAHLEEVAAISAGNHLSNIAVLKDGEVVTWGPNEYGQLGDGSYTPVGASGYTDVPVRVCAPEVPFSKPCEHLAGGIYEGHYLTGVSAVSAAPDHDAAIMQPGGELLTWGVNSRGQLGQGDWNISDDIPEHVCEVEYSYVIPEEADNVLPHCGSGRYLTGVELIAFGDRHNIAQFSGLYCIKVRIKEHERNPEEGEKCRSRDGELVPGEPSKEGKGKKGKGKGSHTWEEEGYEWVEAYANHSVVAFGNNEEGQLGDGLSEAAASRGPAKCEDNAACSEVPIHVCEAEFVPAPAPCEYPHYLEPVRGVAAGGSHSLALSSAPSAEVLSWGENGEGQEGIEATPPGPESCVGTHSCSAVPRYVCSPTGCPGHLTGITQIAGGGSFELALDGTGEVLAWGRGHGGNLGNGANVKSDIPVYVCDVGTGPCTHLTSVTQISAGSSHSLAIGEFPASIVWSKKGSELPKGGAHVTVKTSGTLTLNTEFGPVTCKVKDVEEIWNPASGNGEDLMTVFVLSGCKSKLCPPKQKTEVNALGLPWPSHLTAGSPVRDEIEKVDLEIRCSISGYLDEYKGTLTPEVGNSVLTFGAGSGELEDSLHHKATITGTDKLAGKITA